MNRVKSIVVAMGAVILCLAAHADDGSGVGGDTGAAGVVAPGATNRLPASDDGVGNDTGGAGLGSHTFHAPYAADAPSAAAHAYPAPAAAAAAARASDAAPATPAHKAHKKHRESVKASPPVGEKPAADSPSGSGS